MCKIKNILNNLSYVKNENICTIYAFALYNSIVK